MDRKRNAYHVQSRNGTLSTLCICRSNLPNLPFIPPFQKHDPIPSNNIQILSANRLQQLSFLSMIKRLAPNPLSTDRPIRILRSTNISLRCQRPQFVVLSPSLSCVLNGRDLVFPVEIYLFSIPFRPFSSRFVFPFCKPSSGLLFCHHRTPDYLLHGGRGEQLGTQR